MKLLNAFSANMLGAFPAAVRFSEVGAVEASTALQVSHAGLESCVGHADTAAVFGQQLGVAVPMNRANVVLTKGEFAVLGQYSGPRLPEGATVLPEGATIKWLLIEVY